MKILEILTERREIGNIGERAAAKFLKKRGYKILARNYVAVDKEIDLIAENKTTTAFIEVKTRTIGKSHPSEPRPASAVTPDKQRKIISAAKYFLGTHKADKRIRFDIVEVYVDNEKKVLELKHLESAFNYDTAHPKSRPYS